MAHVTSNGVVRSTSATCDTRSLSSRQRRLRARHGLTITAGSGHDASSTERVRAIRANRTHARRATGYCLGWRCNRHLGGHAMSGYQTVVVGTDGSDSSLRAVDRAGADRRRVGRQADRGDGVLPPERRPARRRRPQGRGLQDVRQCPDLRDPSRGEGTGQGGRRRQRRGEGRRRRPRRRTGRPRRGGQRRPARRRQRRTEHHRRPAARLGARQRGAPLQDPTSSSSTRPDSRDRATSPSIPECP